MLKCIKCYLIYINYKIEAEQYLFFSWANSVWDFILSSNKKIAIDYQGLKF